MANDSTILVTGANGNVGRYLAPHLVEAGKDVRLLVRDAAKRPALPGAHAVAGELADPASLRPALAGVDKVFLLLTLLPGVTNFEAITAEIAKAGVRHVVLLSSVTVFSGTENAIGKLNRRAEQAVIDSGVAYTFLRAGAFTSNALAWAPSIRDEGVVHAPFGSFVSSPVDPRDIAAVAALALLSTGYDGASHVLSGPQRLSILDQVAVLAEVLDREIGFDELGMETAQAQMIASGRKSLLVQSYLRMQRNNDAYLSEIHSTIQDLLGRPATTFRQWAEEFADAFR